MGGARGDVSVSPVRDSDLADFGSTPRLGFDFDFDFADADADADADRRAGAR